MNTVERVDLTLDDRIAILRSDYADVDTRFRVWRDIFRGLVAKMDDAIALTQSIPSRWATGANTLEDVHAVRNNVYDAERTFHVVYQSLPHAIAKTIASFNAHVLDECQQNGCPSRTFSNASGEFLCVLCKGRLVGHGNRRNIPSTYLSGPMHRSEFAAESDRAGV